VTVVAERFSIVAADAIGLFALGVKTMSVLKVKIVNTAGLIIASMTIYAIDFPLMTGLAPLRLQRGLFGVLVPPSDRVDISKSCLAGVTETTVPTGADPIVTPHAQWLALYSRIERSRGVLASRGMTSRTDDFVIQVALMIKQRPQFGLGGRCRVIGVSVALTAGFVIFNIVAGGAHVHRGKVAIVGGSAGFNRDMASGTFNPLIRHVQGV
jgi:hypothetical protein